MVRNLSKISIKAPPKSVWDSLALPQLVKQCQYGSQMVTNCEIGNEIRFCAEWNGQHLEQ